MSTFVERFNNTLARRETKGQDALLAEFKSDQVRRAANGPRYINWGTPQWSSADWDLDRLVRDGYERVIWVWRGVDAIAQHAANLTIRAVKGDVENPFERTFVDDPILRNLNLASWPGTGPKDAPVEMAWQFRYRLSSLLLLSKVGVYVEVVRKRGGGIFSLSLVHPGHCRPIPDIDKLVGAFRVDMPDGGYTDLPPFNPSGNDAHSILWIRKPHPTDPLSATTPLQAAGISIDLDFWARLYNRTFMQNDGRPGGLLAIKGGMQDDDITELRARFGGGPSQAGRTTVVEAEAVSWVDTALSPRDAQYVQSRTITKEEILMALGVSETVIGNAAGKTFDNADNEREVFWEFTMLPHIGILDRAFESLTEGGIDDDVRLWHDTSGIDALQRVQRRKAAEARVDVQLGLKSIDEFRGVDGVKPLDLPETKVLWVPAAGRGAVGDKADVEAANKIHIIAPPPGAGGAGSTKPGATVPGQSREIPTLRRTLSEISGKAEDAEPEVKAIEWAGWATWPAIEAKALDTPGVTSHSTMVAADVSVPASVEDAVMLAAAEFGMQPLDTSEWHVTLAFMGEPSDVDLETIDEVVDDTLPSTLLAGSLGSPAVFGQRGEPRAVVMLVDVPGLAEYRTDLVRALDEAEVPQQSEHGFTAHMTVGYVEPDVSPDALAGLLTTLMSEAGQAISLPSIGLYVGSHRYAGPGEPDPFGSAGETGEPEGKAFDPAQPRDPHTGEWVAGSVGFHGTRYTFKPGDILEGGHSSNQGSGVPGQHVYFTRQRDIAQEFAEYGYGPEGHYNAPPKVYEVEPLDDVEPDPDEDPEVESFRSRRVRVVRRVKADQTATKHEAHGWPIHQGGVATVRRGEVTFTKFDPHQPRDPHTGEWVGAFGRQGARAIGTVTGSQDGVPLSKVADVVDGIEFSKHRDDTWELSRVERESVARHVNAVLDVLPGMPEPRVSHSNSDGIIAAAGGWPRTSLDIGKAYADTPTLVKYSQDWAHGGAIGGGRDVEGTRQAVITHEMGHGVMRALEHHSPEAKAAVDALVNEPRTFRQAGAQYGDGLDTEYKRWQVDSLGPQYTQPASVYASENEREWFAEAFADGFLNGDSASESGKRALAIARQYLGPQ